MQNEQTLIELGFKKNNDGNYILPGRNRVFLAHVNDYSGPPVYVELFYLSKKIDNRPLSPKFGKPLVGRIKDCCSNGSVQRAINSYDIEEK